jgi:hypothetical protein
LFIGVTNEVILTGFIQLATANKVPPVLTAPSPQALQPGPPNNDTTENLMHAINWPADYQPGFTDNYVSNEIIVAGLSADEVWPQLNQPQRWPGYYGNAADIAFHDQAAPELRLGSRFRFMTFGFPVEAEVVEHQPPVAGQPARVAWHGWVEGDAEGRLDVHHAWLFEDLPGGRVRILTQETQVGKPAQQLAATRPNPMLNAHQEWLEGLAHSARQYRAG